MLKVRTPYWSCLLFAFVALFSACVSSPGNKAAPEWILTTPAPDATNTYFVASSKVNGDVGLATEDAASILVSQIMRYMGVRIDVETTGTAKGTVDSYSAELTATVTQSASGRLSGFSIQDRYLFTAGNGDQFIYILAAYQTAELEKEKARIAAVFQERMDAVAGPENAGDEAKAAGRWTEAVKFYVEAALAATGTDIDNAEIKAERTINKAREVLGKLNLARVDAPGTANLGQDFAAPFRVKLSAGEGANSPGIAGAEIIVRYQRTGANGRPQTRTERLLTGPDGIASFAPPPPDAVGKANIRFELNLESTRDLVDQFPRRWDGFTEALLQDMSRRAVEFEYTVVSQARTITTGVAIVDLNDSGAPAGSSTAQGGIFETLARERFKVTLTPIQETLIASMNDSAIVQAARQEWQSKGVVRYVYGVASISGVEQDGTMWKATAVMQVKCVDLSTGQILFSRETTGLAVASSAAEARRAALLNVARDNVAKALMSNLP